jgi:alpha-glucosidase
MMKTLTNITGLLIISLLAHACIHKQKSWQVKSPDGKLALSIMLDETEGTSQEKASLYYAVYLNGKEILPRSPLGIRTESSAGDFTANLRFVEQKKGQVHEVYAMPVGKKSTHINHASELVLTFKNVHDGQIELHARAYDDGVAYRYHIGGTGETQISYEQSGFQVPEGSLAWLQNYAPQYERYYTKHTLQHAAYAGDFAFPLLAQVPTGQWIYITEAATYGTYCGCRLYEDPDDATLFRIRLDGRVNSNLPMTTPWRLIMVGNTLKPIVESSMILNLNPPTELENTEWIDPGVSTFPWLSDHGINSNMKRLKEFVDMAAEMGWKWIEFDNALAFGIDTGSETPFAEWMSIHWIPEFVAYANSKGIKVTGWDNWDNLDTPEKRDSILGYFQQHGFSGIKVDFLDSDSQERFQFRDEIIRECAQRQLMISFHGATLPRGQQRRWPHLTTWEGVLGEESYTYPRGMPTPEHNATLCFTRNVAGSMDYTPTSFTQPGKPGFERTTTDAHQMALAVVFESGWQNIGATPEGLAETEAKSFLKNLPAAWDDIHFIDGYPDDFCVLARRKDNDWYLAGINAGNDKTVSVPLDFLKQGTYIIHLFSDDANGKVTVKEMEADTQNPLDIQLIPNGGFGVVFYDSFVE